VLELAVAPLGGQVFLTEDFVKPFRVNFLATAAEHRVKGYARFNNFHIFFWVNFEVDSELRAFAQHGDFHVEIDFHFKFAPRLEAQVRQRGVLSQELFVADSLLDEERLVIVLVLVVLFLFVLGILVLTRFLGFSRRLDGEDADGADVVHTELFKNGFADASKLDLGHHLDDVVVDLFLRVNLAILLGGGLTSLLNFLHLLPFLFFLVLILGVTFVVTCGRSVWETSILGTDQSLLGEGSHAEIYFNLFDGFCSAFGSGLLNNLAICIVLLLSDALLLILFVRL